VLPINLATALRLANASPIDVALATQRVQAAEAQLTRANTLWLPTLTLGVDYARHDGQLQDIIGKVFTTSRSSFMVGAGPTAVFAVTDAMYAPLAARRVVQAREADKQASVNDSVLAAAESYFTVQQARGEVAGALDVTRRTHELLRRAEGLAEGLIPPVEVDRVRTEVSRRRQGVERAVERWEVASADLVRLLRLAPNSLVSPMEVPQLRTHLVDPNMSVDEMVEVGLSMRPELASRQALVQATLARLKQEKMRPLIPSVLLRGNATNPSGTFSSGLFGGGRNGNLSEFNGRNSIDVQVVWELQNLGLGNRAAVREREAENQQAVLEVFRIQDTIAAEIVRAHSQTRRALNRFHLAEEALGFALTTADKCVEGLKQTRRVGEILQLVFRPLEVVAAIQTLEQAYRDYYGAVADYNRAQFRLYRAMGHPAQCLAVPDEVVVSQAATPLPVPALPGTVAPVMASPLPVVNPESKPLPAPTSLPAQPLPPPQPPLIIRLGQGT
jgi:outer membrane protein TolC